MQVWCGLARARRTAARRAEVRVWRRAPDGESGVQLSGRDRGSCGRGTGRPRVVWSAASTRVQCSRAVASVRRSARGTELAERRGGEQVTLDWLAERLRAFVDLN